MSDMSGRLQTVFREIGNIRSSNDTDSTYRAGVLDAIIAECNDKKQEMADEVAAMIGDIAPLPPEVNPEPVDEG